MSERDVLASLLQSARYGGRRFPATNHMDHRDADRILAAGFHLETPEWEYGVGWDWGDSVTAFRSASREDAEAFVARSPVDDEGEPYYAVRRTRATEPGEWVKL